MNTIILNSSNYVEGTNGSQYEYSFGGSLNAVNCDQIAVVSVNVYNSTNNITSVFANNKVTFTFNSAVPVVIQIIFPDSYMSVGDMNNYLQSIMITNLLYVTNASNQNIYFFELVTNPTLYSVQINAFPIPTAGIATGLGYTKAVGATWNYPTTAQIPQLTISDKFGKLIGFEGGIFPPSIVATVMSVTSTKCPVLSPISSYIMSCNLIQNPYARPSSIIHAIALDKSFGSLITNRANELIWSDIVQGSHERLTIILMDQAFRRLNLIDTDIVITLAIRNKMKDA